jgi:hypothetical protein
MHESGMLWTNIPATFHQDGASNGQANGTSDGTMTDHSNGTPTVHKPVYSLPHWPESTGKGQGDADTLMIIDLPLAHSRVIHLDLDRTLPLLFKVCGHVLSLRRVRCALCTCRVAPTISECDKARRCELPADLFFEAQDIDRFLEAFE